MAPRRRLKVRRPKPTWWMLYALLPLAVGLLVAAHLASSSLAWREVTEGSASLVIMGTMALWIRANRVAIILSDHPQEPDEMIGTREMTKRMYRDDSRSLRQGVDSDEDVIAA